MTSKTMLARMIYSIILACFFVLYTFLFCFRSADKGRKLQEAWEQQQFLREVEDIESWIGEMENQLASDDIGRDLISVNNLIKKHAVSYWQPIAYSFSPRV